MESLKKLSISKNAMLALFIVAFLFLYIGSNSHNTALGIIGISLTVLDAIVILVTK